MGKGGQKPQGKTSRKWSSNLSYAVGLLVTDGSLSKDGRHIDFTSTEIGQINNFKRSLAINHKIGKKFSGSGRLAYRVQFGDVLFYNFLLGIGLTPNKTKTIGKITVPDKYFFDFLRGHHDGDGCFYSYWDPRWKSSFMYYLTFVSSSKDHIYWLQDAIKGRADVDGTINRAKNASCYQLRYAKKDSLKLLSKMYYSKQVLCLRRKRLKIEKALSIVGESL